jgi:hypothetical protein
MIANFIAKFASRILIVSAIVSLAGCAGGNSSADLAPAAPPQAEPAPVTPAPTTPVQRGAPVGRSTQAAPPPAAPARQTAASPEEIKAQCWMKYEDDKKIKNIDQRLALVEKCIAETSSNQPPQRN